MPGLILCADGVPLFKSSGNKIDHLHVSFCHGNGSHFGAQPLLNFIVMLMAAVAVTKLLLCICKCSIRVQWNCPRFVQKKKISSDIYT